MKSITTLSAALALIVTASAATSQLVPGLPGVGDLLRPVPGVIDALPDRLARTLETARIDRIARLVRDHPESIALDPDGFPARASEVIANDPDDALVAAAAAVGFRVIERGDVLGIGFVRFATPVGVSLKAAIRLLAKLGARDVSADQLHVESGAVTGFAQAEPGAGPPIGMIDGGVAGSVAEQRGFATGAPRASDHGSAVASLITGAGSVRGAALGARLFAADVYGSDPAGGSASAIVKALGWLVGRGVSVVTVSLVGPANPLLARVVAAAQARGVVIVAAVGNDGPASPPGYPASYPGVIAVTGVDLRGRVLIEAGRALHLDYAAPGADMLAGNARGAAVAVRGTSFAAPLVAATIARAYPAPDPAKRQAALARVDAQADRRGKGYGRGLVCRSCRTPAR